ncbi:PREDICTED: 1,8-cineole synthase 1, chloroplastic-like isoform X2 [Tarenaya hassleriana]|uniref:1,8-cineole synthase 1, chloroplastic-like isoform X2 n=1 Tax=Tarenaya hassleriana TaxID=28532 RepID=UPI00053C1D0F|nr:PREDICTED: 1,8-cineole synthase 1, chloroplastic-like isoform X2 [Tarenaya hassleriana]
MASLGLGGPLIYGNAPLGSMQNRRRRTPPRLACHVAGKTTSAEAVVVRRSGNYRPSVWDENYIHSLENKYASQFQDRAKLLEEHVRNMLDGTEGSLKQLELIDTLQRLGLSHHFGREIKSILQKIYTGRQENDTRTPKTEDLHAIALEFRLLRQHGFTVSQDVFDVIKNEKEYETFIEDLDDSVKGLLSLYEASYLSTKSDTKLKEIRSYSTKRLRDFMIESGKNDENESYIHEMMVRSLEMPYHWRTSRLEARWYIDVYGKTKDMNPLLLEFAKLDFNITQASYQEDLKDVSRWWSNTGLKKLHFARDRILENYFWTVELFHEPEFAYHRQKHTIVNALVTTIDDIYDIYGTIEELQQFTEIIRKWDVNLLDELPEYMRSCFLVLYNETNQIGHDILRDKKFNVIPYLKKAWADLADSYLKEAKWHKSGYKPRFEEYIENAWISISAPVILTHTYCILSDRISKETFDTISENSDPIVRSSSVVLRVANDLGTSPDELARGDVLKSMQCYMHETGASEEEAREHMTTGVISDAWDEMNYNITARGSSVDSRFFGVALDLGRMAQCMYQYGDGHGCPDIALTVDRAHSLLFDPVPLD